MLQQFLEQKRMALRKEITIKKLQGIAKVIEYDNIEYEMLTKEGAGVIKNEQSKDWYQLKTKEGTPVVSVTQAGKTFYFKRIDQNDTPPPPPPAEVPSKKVYNWYNFFYEDTEEFIEKVTVNIPNDLKRYIPGEDAQRPFLSLSEDLIEAAEDSKLYEIVPGLFLGSQDAASNDLGLQQSNVTHILNVATGITYHKNPSITYKTVEIMDLPEVNITTHFDDVFKFITEGMGVGGVLVHCNAGVSRSASVIIAFLMFTKKCTFEEAFQLVKSKKKDIAPNEGFRVQLKLYEVTLSTEK